MAEEKADVKCAKCKCYRYPSEFLNAKGRELKTCKKCRDLATKSRQKYKCIHGRQKAHCKHCAGSSICEHGRQKAHCVECGGASICVHGRRKIRCKECGGASICEHGRQRGTCKDCMNDEQKIEYIQKTMIKHSRQADKKSNRYDPDHFIDKPFLEGLFEDSQNCHYCGVQFTHNEKIGTLVTIERLNNSIGHIKSNCVLACWDCNTRHKSRDEEIEEKSE
jgi:hypothetical protein